VNYGNENLHYPQIEYGRRDQMQRRQRKQIGDEEDLYHIFVFSFILVNENDEVLKKHQSSI